MSERDPYPAGPRHEAPDQPPADWHEDTTPGLRSSGGSPFSGAGSSPVGAGGAGAAGGAVGAGGAGAPYGAVGTGAPGYPEQTETRYTTPQYSTSPVTVRRPDLLAALLLVLAGIAAAVSLALEWLRDEDETGYDLVDRGLDVARTDAGALGDTGTWQPLAIVFGGGVLLVLGLLMLLPARGHRTLGVLALLVSLAVTAAVVVIMSDAGWDLGDFGTGLWLAVAVAALGILGSLKAMVTNPKVR